MERGGRQLGGRIVFHNFVVFPDAGNHPSDADESQPGFNQQSRAGAVKQHGDVELGCIQRSDLLRFGRGGRCHREFCGQYHHHFDELHRVIDRRQGVSLERGGRQLGGRIVFHNFVVFPNDSEPAVSADTNQSRQQHFAGAEPVHTDADFQLESGQWCQWLWSLHQGLDDRVVCLSLFHQFRPDNDHTPARHLARLAQRISGQWPQLRLEHDHVQQRWSRRQRFKCQRTLFPDSSEPAVSADANQSRQQHFAGAEPVHTDADFQLECRQWCQWLWSLHQDMTTGVVCLSLFHQFQPDNDHTPARHLARLAQRISGQWPHYVWNMTTFNASGRRQRFSRQRSLFPDSSEPAVSADANQSRQQHFAGAEPVHTDADFQLESVSGANGYGFTSGI